MRKLLILALIIFGIFFLSTCENAISLIDEIETEVKIGNDLFLVIKTISPGESSVGVDPGADISISFDRSVDMSTVNSVTIKIIESYLHLSLITPRIHLTIGSIGA